MLRHGLYRGAILSMKLAQTMRRHIPEIDAAIRKEEATRAAALLAGLTFELCGVQVGLFTPAHRFELGLIGSPLFDSRPMSARDCFVALWRMSPHFRRETPLFSLARLRKEWMSLRFWIWVKRHGLFAAEKAIRESITSQNQDMPPPPRSIGDDGALTESESSPPPAVNGAVHSAMFWRQNFSMSQAEYMSTPVALLNQYYRLYLWQQGDQLHSINESDRIAQRIMREHIKQSKRAATCSNN